MTTFNQLVELREATHSRSRWRSHCKWLYEDESGVVSISDWHSSNTYPSVGRILARSNAWSLADSEGFTDLPEDHEDLSDPAYINEEAREWASIKLDDLEESA